MPLPTWTRHPYTFQVYTCLFLPMFCIFLNINAQETYLWGSCIFLAYFLAYFFHIFDLNLHIFAYLIFCNACSSIYIHIQFILMHILKMHLCIFSFAFIKFNNMFMCMVFFAFMCKFVCIFQHIYTYSTLFAYSVPHILEYFDKHFYAFLCMY